MIEILKSKIDYIKNHKKYEYFTTIDGVDDYMLLKTAWHRAIKRYEKTKELEVLDDSSFWNKYCGLSHETSKQINDILINAIAEGYWTDKNEIISEIVKLGVDKKQAETIVITELSNFANRLRLEMYKNTRVRLVKVKNENDGRVCELCKRVASATKLGVPINEIEQRIYELTNGKSRGYAIHPRCRCIIIRANESPNKKHWE
jgi:hypothetical protein